jgi:hypothetical protein
MTRRPTSPTLLLLPLVIAGMVGGGCRAAPPADDTASSPPPPGATAGSAGESTETIESTEYELVAIIERGPLGPEDAVTDLHRAIRRLEARSEGATAAERRKLSRSIEHLRSLELELAGRAALEPPGSVLARAYAGLARTALRESDVARQRGEPTEAAGELRTAVDHLARSLSAAESVDARSRAILVDGRELALRVEREGLAPLDSGQRILDDLERLADEVETPPKR